MHNDVWNWKEIDRLSGVCSNSETFAVHFKSLKIFSYVNFKSHSYTFMQWLRNFHTHRRAEFHSLLVSLYIYFAQILQSHRMQHQRKNENRFHDRKKLKMNEGMWKNAIWLLERCRGNWISRQKQIMFRENIVNYFSALGCSVFYSSAKYAWKQITVW